MGPAELHELVRVAGGGKEPLIRLQVLAGQHLADGGGAEGGEGVGIAWERRGCRIDCRVDGAMVEGSGPAQASVMRAERAAVRMRGMWLVILVLKHTEVRGERLTRPLPRAY